MIQKSGIMAAITGVGIVAALLMAGFAVNTVSGQATDGAPTDDIFVPSLPSDEATEPEPTDVGPPPASPIEPSTDPLTDPSGGPLAADDAPTGLPDAGYGPTETLASFVTLLSLMAVAGIALLGAGMAATNGRRS
jgi:hypothetical protein